MATTPTIEFFESVFGKNCGITTVWITDQNSLQHAFQKGLLSLYRICFSALPYLEKHDESDLRATFRTEVINKALILIVYDKNKNVIAFSVKTPVRNCPEDVKKNIPNDIEHETCIFGSELGVDPIYRKKGISRILENMQAAELLKRGFKQEVSRTSISNYPRIAGNLKAGKRRIQGNQTVEMLRIDGSLQSDERLFFKWEIGNEDLSLDGIIVNVIIKKINGKDIAIVDKLSIPDDRKIVMKDVIVTNYPGLYEVQYSDENDDLDIGGELLFAGDMPFVDSQGKLDGSGDLLGDSLLEIERSLLDKIPTFRELRGIAALDCGETMLKGVSNEFVYFRNMATEMFEFTGDNIYLRSSIIKLLKKAGKILKNKNPDYLLQVHYGYRHPMIQHKRYNELLGKIQANPAILDKEQYTHTFIAEPSVAAHPTGAAVDVTIINRHTKIPIDMGTNLREFSQKCLTFFPGISKQQWFNRNLLRNTMVVAGFCPYDGEWWHFSYGDREWAYHLGHEWAIYDIINFKEKHE